jgi:hypothetical protein
VIPCTSDLDVLANHGDGGLFRFLIVDQLRDRVSPLLRPHQVIRAPKVR